jgi:hypothetical protein
VERNLALAQGVPSVRSLAGKVQAVLAEVWSAEGFLLRGVYPVEDRRKASRGVGAARVALSLGGKEQEGSARSLVVQACCQNDWKLEQLGCSVPARVRPRPHSTCPTGDQPWPSFFLRPPHGCSPALLGDHDKPVCTRRLEFVTNSFFS